MAGPVKGQRPTPSPHRPAPWFAFLLRGRTVDTQDGPRQRRKGSSTTAPVNKPQAPGTEARANGTGCGFPVTLSLHEVTKGGDGRKLSFPPSTQVDQQGLCREAFCLRGRECND